jgi:hypothetical protein
MLDWIFDFPSWASAGLLCASFVAVTWAATLALRTYVQAQFHGDRTANYLVGFTFTGFAVFYGLLLGLVAVSAYQTYSNADDEVSREAASLGVLYHEVSAYPSPTREAMQAELRNYTLDTIDRAWPLQQKGVIPTGGPQRMADLYSTLLAFSPRDSRESIIHAETLRTLNEYVELRRVRLSYIEAGLPDALWWVVIVGAVVSILYITLFDMKLQVHLMLGGLFALFLAITIFLIAEVNYPFRGAVSVSPAALRDVYDTVMR